MWRRACLRSAYLPALVLGLLRLLGLVLLDVLLRVVVKGIAAAATAKVISFSFVADLHRAQAAAHDAFRVRVTGAGKRNPFLGGPDPVDASKQRTALRLHLIAVQEARPVQQGEDEALRFLVRPVL